MQRPGRYAGIKARAYRKVCSYGSKAFMEIPKSWSKIKRLEAEYGVIKPTCKPDLDNIG